MTYNPTIPIVTSKILKMDVESLRNYRERYRDSIIQRLGEFDAMRRADGRRIFYELCFCILTPQSSGLACDRIVAELAGKGVLIDPVARRRELEETLRRTRFWRKKTGYVIKAWKRFVSNGDESIKELLAGERGLADRELRNWFRKEVRGMGLGMKEASHFLRNVGFGSGIAIVDRHILRCLQELGVTAGESHGVRSRADYLRIEELMAGFSSDSGIPLSEMDLLLWSSRTGYIFK